MQTLINITFANKIYLLSETFAKIISRKRDNAGNPVGARDSNPRLDGRIYIGELPDGGLEEFTANMVAENLFAQCDDNDNIYKIFDVIIDCYKDGDLVCGCQMEGWEHIISAPPCDERIGAPRNGRVCSGRTGRGLARIRLLGPPSVE